MQPNTPWASFLLTVSIQTHTFEHNISTMIILCKKYNKVNVQKILKDSVSYIECKYRRMQDSVS